jgi:chemotaxis response regulator CheB
VSALPENCGVAVVFIQHLDPHHESMLSQILSRNTQIAVSEATETFYNSAAAPAPFSNLRPAKPLSI